MKKYNRRPICSEVLVSFFCKRHSQSLHLGGFIYLELDCWEKKKLELLEKVVNVNWNKTVTTATLTFYVHCQCSEDFKLILQTYLLTLITQNAHDQITKQDCLDTRTGSIILFILSVLFHFIVLSTYLLCVALSVPDVTETGQ